MKQHRIATTALAASALLAVAPGARAAQPPDPAQVAQQCVQQVTARAAHRVQHNQIAAAQCTTLIAELLEQGDVPAAFHAAQHCIHRIVARTHYTQMRNQITCAHCIQVLLALDAPGLARLVGNVCGEAAAAVAGSRQQAVQAILDVLPEPPAELVLTPCLPDVEGDGVVGITDLVDLLAAWGTDPEAPPDLDFDGVVGVQDLLVMVQAWGTCPG